MSERQPTGRAQRPLVILLAMSGDATASGPTDAERDQALAGLVARIAAGEEQALADLYDLTLGRVYGLALRILGQREAAEDATAEVYLQVWRQAGDYRASRGSVLAWLLTICRARALDARRRRDRAQSHPNPDLLRTEPQGEAPPPDILESVESGRALHAALKGLSSEQRQALGLAFFRDLSQREIADRMGLPLGTVKSHIRRAQLALRAALSDPET